MASRQPAIQNYIYECTPQSQRKFLTKLGIEFVCNLHRRLLFQNFVWTHSLCVKEVRSLPSRLVDRSRQPGSDQRAQWTLSRQPEQGARCHWQRLPWQPLTTRRIAPRCETTWSPAVGREISSRRYTPTLCAPPPGEQDVQHTKYRLYFKVHH